MKIEKIDQVHAQIPYRRGHTQSFGSAMQSEAIFVRVFTDDGLVGYGEACVSGGPYWNEESPESMYAVCERYLAPRLIGMDPRSIGLVVDRMNVVSGNYFIKSALEMACVDIAGKAAGLPAHQLFGGARRDTMRMLWSLGIGDPKAELEEMAQIHETWGITHFKVKVGHESLAHDLNRLEQLAEGLSGNVVLRPDANQGWDEHTALQALPVLERIGVEVLEQPLPKWNISGLARVRNASRVPIMADESVTTPQDALALAKAGAVDLFALKLSKSGGMTAVMNIAAIAEAAGIGCYMGGFVESGLGTAAYLQAAAAAPDMSWGVASAIGPIMLAVEILEDPIVVESGIVHLPEGAGLGVTPDWKVITSLAVK